MTDAKSAVEAAFYQALASSVTGATVYQDVPENADLPIIIVGDMKSAPLGAKNDPDRRVSVLVVAMVAAEERAPLLDLQRQIEAALDGRVFTPTGWRLAVTFEDDDAQLAEDGVSYVGTSAFDVLALTT
ncbi:MAG: DUF3168 domain-containing protein [Burkholderiaceae bacterium]